MRSASFQSRINCLQKFSNLQKVQSGYSKVIEAKKIKKGPTL